MSSESLNTTGAFSQAKDLKNRIFFTILILIIYRLGTYVPLAGIDPIAIQDVKKLIQNLKNRNIGVLMTDHNVKSTLEIVDRAYIIFEGKVLFKGRPDEIIKNKNVRTFYLGNDF